jgi:spore germination protein YaaH
VAGEKGEISEWCSNDYVKAVHNAGMEVWIVVNDLEPNTKTANVLKDSDKRENLEKNIVSKVKEYKAEGINVDFECVTTDSSPYYIQFIRELSVLCRKEQLVLSVDSYVSMPYNSFYYRDKVAEVADYVVIMGYDEHHSNSEEMGSNASISWTKKGIENSLSDGVPSDKLIVTVPFYARLFGVPEGQSGFTDCNSYSMTDQQTLLKDENLTPTWDADTMQNYIEYNKDGKVWFMWMEDNKSIEAKLKVIKEAGIAGTGFWNIGYASSDVWDVVEKYTK